MTNDGLFDGLELLEQPGSLQSADAEQLLVALGALSRVRRSLDHWEPVLIDAARAHGLTWAQIAPALGVGSRQAAERRYLRLKPQAVDEPGMTREERVDATRNQRSADRAVADWARGNAATLRQLAGQVAALPVDALAAEARVVIERIRKVLGSDDVAELIQPLSDVARSLRAGHARLAGEISLLVETTDEIRDSDLSRRTTAAAP
ncbi:hypothetical protein AB0E69_10770 [Kribbella sp. NPDC026611]|uniref:hypothetical protein n=1 Tax=Kribbella sp. NPDC026611 TaxID=3154911 RepID=UPI0033C6688F